MEGESRRARRQNAAVWINFPLFAALIHRICFYYCLCKILWLFFLFCLFKSYFKCLPGSFSLTSVDSTFLFSPRAKKFSFHWMYMHQNKQIKCWYTAISTVTVLSHSPTSETSRQCQTSGWRRKEGPHIKSFAFSDPANRAACENRTTDWSAEGRKAHLSPAKSLYSYNATVNCSFHIFTCTKNLQVSSD